MGSERAQLSHPWVRRVLAAALAGALFGGIAFSLERSRVSTNRRLDFALNAPAGLPAFQAQLDAAVAAVEMFDVTAPVNESAFDAKAGEALGASPLSAVALYTTAIGSASLGTKAAAVVATGEASPPPVSDSDVAAAISNARDTGGVSAGGRTVGGSVPIVRAVYAGSPPVGTVARRSQVNGYVIGFLRPQRVVSRTVGAYATTVNLEISDGSNQISRIGNPTKEGLARSLTVADRQWIVRLSPSVDLDPVSTSAWIALIAGVAFGAAGSAGAMYLLYRLREARTESAERARGLAFVSELGPLLQSLELSEVLPAVLLTLSDVLDCSAIRVALADDRGQLMEAFALGDPLPLPDDIASLPLPVESAEAGEVVVLSLLRANRAIAALGLRSSRALRERDMILLRASGELLAAAIVNSALYERERSAVRRMAELDAMRSSFIATASHELRTPVTAIQGFTRFLHEEWSRYSEDERRDLISRIDHHAGFLAGLMQDLLDLTQLDRDSFAVHLEPIELGQFVRDVISRQPAGRSAHRLELAEVASRTAHADRVALERILENLLSNAVKYSPTGSVITLAVGGAADAPTITVDDAGPGIAPEERRVVFNPFYRGESEHVTRTRGAGIGLAVVADLVERLHGRVRVATSPAGGTRIEVRLQPAVDADLEGTA